MRLANLDTMRCPFLKSSAEILLLRGELPGALAAACFVNFLHHPRFVLARRELARRAFVHIHLAEREARAYRASRAARVVSRRTFRRIHEVTTAREAKQRHYERAGRRIKCRLAREPKEQRFVVVALGA